MKKIFIALLSLTLTFNVFSAQFTDGREFLTLREPVFFKEFQVLEFFSFYCFPCFQFEELLHTSGNIKKELSKNIGITKYHIDSLGPFGKELTKAWAVAIVLGVEDKIILPMFVAVQKTHSIRSVSDIRNVFINSGIKEKVFDTAWNSFSVKFLVDKQKRVASLFHLKETPTVYVSGKYKINLIALNKKNTSALLQQYIGIIKFLMKRK